MSAARTNSKNKQPMLVTGSKETHAIPHPRKQAHHTESLRSYAQLAMKIYRKARQSQLAQPTQSL